MSFAGALTILDRIGELVRKYSEDQPRDEVGRWTEAGGGGTGTVTETVPRGSGFIDQDIPFAFGPALEVNFPLDRNVSILYQPETDHLGWAGGMALHEDVLDEISRTAPLTQEERDRYVHISYQRTQNDVPLRVITPHTTDRLQEQRDANRSFLMLRLHGFSDATEVRLIGEIGGVRTMTLGDTVRVRRFQRLLP